MKPVLIGLVVLVCVMNLFMYVNGTKLQNSIQAEHTDPDFQQEHGSHVTELLETSLFSYTVFVNGKQAQENELKVVKNLGGNELYADYKKGFIGTLFYAKGSVFTQIQDAYVDEDDQHIVFRLGVNEGTTYFAQASSYNPGMFKLTGYITFLGFKSIYLFNEQ